MLIVKEGQFQQCSLHSSIAKELSTGEFVATSQTITGTYYLEALKRLIARICCIRPEYRDPETWSLLHDNALSHTSLIVRRFLVRNKFCVLIYAPYSPDLTLCDFSLFPKLKFKGCFFNDISTIRAATTWGVEVIQQSELEHAYESLLNRCNKCIETGGEYFE